MKIYVECNILVDAMSVDEMVQMQDAIAFKFKAVELFAEHYPVQVGETSMEYIRRVRLLRPQQSLMFLKQVYDACTTLSN